MKKTKAAIIGCGNIAGLHESESDSVREKPSTHVGAYRTRKEIEVVGCCDIDIKKAEAFATQFGIKFCTDSYEDLLSLGIDILSICVPYKLHYETLKNVLKLSTRPKIVFLEKPISNDLNKARAMVEVCQKKRVKLYVNNRRLTSVYLTLLDIIKEEFNNDIISVAAWCSSGIHTVGIHLIDLLRSICGEIDWVFASREKEYVEKLPHSHNFTSDDSRFASSLGFKNGVKAFLFNTAKTDFIYFEIEVLCRKGRIRVSDNGGKIVYQKKIKPGKSMLSYRLSEEKSIRVDSKKRLFKNIIDEIIKGDYRRSPINGKEALKSYAVIDAMERSSKYNKIQYIKK